MISYTDFSDLCKKYNFIIVRCTAGVDFVGFYLENNRDFCTVGMFAAYDCWIYNDIGFNYNVDVFQRTLCKSKEDFEKGLQNAVMLKKKLLIKTKIDEIEREFK
ncbi:MAG: hypothetical protein IKP65_06840 [Alphaproteobacteria bacterium]|nr:hypothetical protein [Alphaproteobacteria bacterium]